MREHFNNAVLDGGYQLAHAELAPTQIDKQVADDLAGAVICHLAAAIDLNHRNIAGRDDMLGLAGLALRKHARMLQQPHFIECVCIARIGEGAHCIPHGLIIGEAELADTQLHQITTCTRPEAFSSLKMIFKCSSPCAVMVTRTDRNLPLLLARTSTVVSSKSSVWRCMTSTT